jgi:hypothetical protein
MRKALDSQVEEAGWRNGIISIQETEPALKQPNCPPNWLDSWLRTGL